MIQKTHAGKCQGRTSSTHSNCRCVQSTSSWIWFCEWEQSPWPVLNLQIRAVLCDIVLAAVHCTFMGDFQVNRRCKYLGHPQIGGCGYLSLLKLLRQDSWFGSKLLIFIGCHLRCQRLILCSSLCPDSWRFRPMEFSFSWAGSRKLCGVTDERRWG